MTDNQPNTDQSSVNFSPALRVLGICAFIGAFTTFLNTMAPRFYSASSFDEMVALIHHPVYAARQWVLLVHPLFTLLLALGFLLALFRRAPGRSSSAFTFAFVEKMTEFLLGVSILFVVNGMWKAGYLAGDGPVSPQNLELRIRGFNDLLGGLYFLLWVMFILSTGLFASCLKWVGKLNKAVIVSAVIMIILTLLLILGQYAGQSSWTRPIIIAAYGPVLTIHRALIGFWLLKESKILKS